MRELFISRESSTFRRLVRFVLIMTVASLALAQEKQGDHEAASDSKDGITVPAIHEGDRVLFYLPESWLSRFWKNATPPKAYIAQLPPHKRDTEEDYAPCHAPQRIVTGYIDAANKVHEKLVTCVNFCDTRPKGKLFYTGLWGRLTRLKDVEVRVLPDGMLDLQFRFNKLEDSTIRIRHLRINGPREALPAGEAGSCE